MATPSPNVSVRNAPIATLLATIAPVVIFFLPAAVDLLAYDRARVLAGQWWRPFTGNWVHFRGSELWWNLAILVPAGVWSERLRPLPARVLFLLCPALVGGFVFYAFPYVNRFAGLSGLATGLVTLLALVQLRSGASDRWFWRAVLALLALKVATEALLGSGRLGGGPNPAMQVVALIHLVGMCSGAIVLRQRRRPKA